MTRKFTPPELHLTDHLHPLPNSQEENSERLQGRHWLLGMHDCGTMKQMRIQDGPAGPRQGWCHFTARLLVMSTDGLEVTSESGPSALGGPLRERRGLTLILEVMENPSWQDIMTLTNKQLCAVGVQEARTLLPTLRSLSLAKEKRLPTVFISTAALTSFHKLSGFKQHKSMILQLWRSHV